MAADESRGERYARRRGVACLVFTLMAMIFTAQILSRVEAGTANGPTVFGWLMWQMVPLIWVYVGPGRLRRIGLSRFSAADMAVIDDELVRANRAVATRNGYAVLLAGTALVALSAVGAVAVPGWTPLVVLDGGVAATALTFAILEIRANAG